MPNAIEVEDPGRGLVGVRREEDQVRPPGGAPERRREPRAPPSRSAEAEPAHDPGPFGRERRREAQQRRLEDPERHRDHHVRAGLGGAGLRPDRHPSIRPRRPRPPASRGVRRDRSPWRPRRSGSRPGQVAEVVLVVLLLRPQPRERLLLGGAGGVRLDARAQALPRAPQSVPVEPGRGHEGLDPVGRGRVRPQPVAERVQGRGEAAEVARPGLRHLLGREPGPGAHVERRQGRQRVARPALDPRRARRSGAAGCPTGGAATTHRGRPASRRRPPCAAGRRPVAGPRAPCSRPPRGAARWRP